MSAFSNFAEQPAFSLHRVFPCASYSPERCSMCTIILTTVSNIFTLVLIVIVRTIAYFCTSSPLNACVRIVIVRLFVAGLEPITNRSLYVQAGCYRVGSNSPCLNYEMSIAPLDLDNTSSLDVLFDFRGFRWRRGVETLLEPSRTASPLRERTSSSFIGYNTKIISSVMKKGLFICSFFGQ